MAINSFQKGTQFEEFVLHNLFPEGDYILIHRTNNYEENKSRFSENSLLPDFKFRCKNTGVEFYLECKYRSNFNIKQQIDVISQSQRTRLLEVEKNEKTPIYFCIGIEGEPIEPQSICLIPFNELIYDSLYQSFLSKYSIPKKQVLVDQLNLPDSINKSTSQINFSQEKKTIVNTKSKKKAIPILIILVLFSLVFILKKPTNKDKIEDRVNDYYSILQKGEIQKIDEFIVPITDQWFSKQNVSVSQIKAIAYNYKEKYPIVNFNIDLSTFIVEEHEGNFLVEYIMDYSIENPQNNFKKNFTLKINSTWNSDFMITSMVEKKLN